MPGRTNTTQTLPGERQQPRDRRARQRAHRGERERSPTRSRRGPSSTSAHSASGTERATASARQAAVDSGTLVKVTDREDREREQVDQRLREHGAGDDREHAARGPVQAAREHDDARRLAERPGKTAEPITPIIVARTTGGQRIGVSGSAARSTSCQEIERSSSESAISASASTIQPGVAVIRACPTRRGSAARARRATSPASKSTTSDEHRRAGAARRNVGQSSGPSAGLSAVSPARLSAGHG